MLLQGFKVYADISNVLSLLKDLDGEDGYTSSNLVKDKVEPLHQGSALNFPKSFPMIDLYQGVRVNDVFWRKGEILARNRPLETNS